MVVVVVAVGNASSELVHQIVAQKHASARKRQGMGNGNGMGKVLVMARVMVRHG